MTIRAFTALGLWCLISPTAGAAEDVPALTCTGMSPDWTLSLTGSDAAFEYQGQQQQFDIPHQVRAEGRDWPMALTLIGRGISAAVLIEPRSCGATPWEIRVLTNDGMQPIVLAGCCTEAVE